MAYKKEEIELIFNDICDIISEGSRSLKSILRDEGMPSSQTFYKWLSDDVEKSNQYARACELRAHNIFDEMFDISDDGSNDWMEIKDKEGENIGWKVNGEAVQRSKLRIDARKWALSKMSPKKYGDASLIKIANNEGGELKINAIFQTDLLNVPADDSPKEDS